MTSSRCPVYFTSTGAVKYGQQCHHSICEIPNEHGLFLCKKHFHLTQEQFDINKGLVEKIKKKMDIRASNIKKNIDVWAAHPGEIPLYNIDNEIVKFAQVSPDDYIKVNEHTWSFNKGVGYAYNEKKESMHSFVFKLHHFMIEDKTNVIDHIDQDKLNNQFENLRLVTVTQNNQNKMKLPGLTSKYIGVSWRDDMKKWTTTCVNKVIGYYPIEEDAGKAYDTYVLLLLGENSKTNQLIEFKDIPPNMVAEDVIQQRLRRKLDEEDVSYRKDTQKYQAQVTIGGKRHYKDGDNEDEVKAIKQELLQERNEYNKRIEEEQDTLPIERNEIGQAIINIANDLQIIVDDDKWHALKKISWWTDKKTKDGRVFIVSEIEVNDEIHKIRLNRYLTNPREIDEVSYINNNTLDNRLSNLLVHQKGARLPTTELVDGVRKYLGVSVTPSGKWRARIKLNGKEVLVGNYNTALLGAIARDKRILEEKERDPNCNIIMNNVL